MVVTGIGMVTPLGVGLEDNWRAACEGRSGAGRITRFDATDHACQIACEVPDFRPEEFINRRALRRMDRVAQLAVAAARLAVADAGLSEDDLGAWAGATIATGNGGNESYEENFRALRERGPERMSPFAVPSAIPNMAAAQVSMQLGLGGPLAVPITACASGTHAMGEGAESVRRGDVRVMLAGGTESGVTPFCMAALDATRALSRRNDDPEAASRPFDAGRDGFVAAEGAALLVLEDAEEAAARGAEPYCELAGYGSSADAFHLTEPDPSLRGQVAAMRDALRTGGLDPEEIDYVSAHGTSTPTGDGVEIGGIRQALGDAHAARTAVSSTKSMHGHGMGAAGGFEAALTALTIREGIIPPTINLDNLDPECEGVDHVAGVSRQARVRAALSNSFGFGGHNAVIALKEVRG